MPKHKKNRRHRRSKTSSRSSFLVFLFPFVAVGTYLVWLAFAASSSLTLYLSPSSKTLTRGDNLPVQIRLQNINSSNIHYVKTSLTYPTDKLSCSSISFAQSDFPNSDQAPTCNSGSTIVVVQENPPSTSSSPDALVATINFATKLSGTAVVSFINSQTVAAKQTGGGNQLTATNGGSYVINSPAPTVSLTVNPSSVKPGGSSTLSWSTTNATSCTASGAWSGTKATSGSTGTGALNATSTFNLSCSGSGGTASASKTVTVSSTTPPPSPTPPPTSTPPPSPTPGPTPSPSPSPSAAGPSTNNSNPAANPAATITGVTINSVNQNSATISWATPSVSTGKVTYGTNLDDQNQSVSADTALASHQVTLTNLQPGQKYYFTISASYANNQYKYQGEVTTAGGSYSSQPTPTATSKSPKTLALIAIAILGLSGSAAWFFLSGGRHKKLGLPGANPFQHILMHEAVLHHPTAHTPAHAPPKEAPPVHHLPPKVETPPKPEPPQKPLPPNPNIPYQPHSLIPKDKLAGHAKKTGSIAADSIDEPKDMFEEGRERLEHEGLGKDGQPQ